MFDIKSIGKTKYVPATAIEKKTFSESVNFGLLLLRDVFKVFGATLLLFVNTIIEIFKPRKPKQLDGKIALVTGGGNGLGRYIAFQLAKENCNIAIGDIDLDAAKRTATEIKSAFNVKCETYRVDVSDYEDIERMREKIKKDLGTVNILVNNAGLIPYASLREKHWTDIDKLLRVNINSHVWTTRVFLEDMIKEKDGHIVAIASVAGLLSGPYMITYSATKHAVTGFMACLADELITDGHDYVKTTCICPYFINTRKEYMDIVNLRFPPLDPEDVAIQVVDSIKKDKELVILIKYKWMCKLALFLPISIQRIVGDIIFDSKNARTMKKD